MLKALNDFLAKNPVLKGIAGIAALIIIVLGFHGYVQGLVERTVTDEAYLRKLSERVRPYAILDGKGTVLVNGGAMEYIDGRPKFETSTNGFPQKVVITPKAFMSHAPLFNSLDDSTLFYTYERGQGIDWEYTLRPRSNVRVTEDSPKWTNQMYRFRLEILY